MEDPITAGEPKKRLSPTLWLTIFLAGLAMMILVFVAASKSYVPHKPIAMDEGERMARCRQSLQDTLKLKAVDLQVLAGIHGLCYAEVNEDDTLVEFGIRRSAFLNQQAQTTVLLWMVVGITMSGVILAGVQLIAGYRLAYLGRASFDQGGQVSVDKTKISLNSSVTGLVILVVSLAFFYIFVTQVYLIREVGIAPPKSEAGNPDLTSGWSGAGNTFNKSGTSPKTTTKSGEGQVPPNLVGGGLGLAPNRPPQQSDGKPQKAVQKP